MTKDQNKKKLDEKINNQIDNHDEDRTPLDRFTDQKFVDDIPLQDLKIETEQEKNKHETQDDSQSQYKYQADFKKDKSK